MTVIRVGRCATCHSEFVDTHNGRGVHEAGRGHPPWEPRTADEAELTNARALAARRSRQEQQLGEEHDAR